jgi:hypothetical protein
MPLAFLLLEMVDPVDRRVRVASDRGATAVGGDDRAGDVARARRGEEPDDLGDLLGVRGPVE